MDINKFTNTYSLKYKEDKDFKNKEEALSPFSSSIFGFVGDCIKKADTSGDGVLSEEEISVFMNNDYEEILSNFEEEIKTKGQDVDTSIINQLTNMIKSMLSSFNKEQEDSSSLEEMSKENFVEKSIEAKEDKNSSMFWQLMGLSDAEGIFDNIDTDKDGILSKKELEKLSMLDKDNQNISLQDLETFFNEGTQEETAKTEVEKTENKQEETITKEVQQQRVSNYSSGSGSVQFNSPQKVAKNEKRTVDIIDKEIEENNTLKETTQSKAKDEIAEQDKLIANALEESELSEEFKEEYNSENEKFTKEITEKDNEIKENKNQLQDYNAQADSLGSAVNDIDSQIQSMEAKKGELNPEENADKISEYTNKINNLRTKKKEYEEKQEELKNKAKETEEKISKLEQEKQDLTTQKDNILDTLMNIHSDEKEKIQSLKEQISTYEDNKKNIENELQSALSKIDTDIQALKTEKAEVKQKEETNSILNENKVVADNAPEEVKDDISSYTIEDWKKLGYDENAGNNLGDEARDVATRMGNAGSKGNCLGGVKRAFIAATGNSPFGNPEEGITVASKCITVMEENENFKEITGISKTDLQYLPAGAVIVWSSSTTGDSAASKYGHISISLGDGNEASDRLHAQYYSVGENGKPRVFIPV